MASDIPDLSGADFRDAGAAVLKGSAVLAATHANDDPDAAARSAQLGAATGIPGNVIHLDPKRFEEGLKTKVVQGIVGGNQSLAQYAGSDPMAPIVSNDDWGHLDTLSGALTKLKDAIGPIVEPLTEPVPQITREDLAKQYPGAFGPQGGLLGKISGTLAAGGLNLAEIGLQSGSAIFGTISNVLEATLPKDIAAMLEYEMYKPEGGGAPAIQHALQAVPGLAWLKAGKEPPAGVHPEFDKLKVERNQELLKSLDESQKLVQQSTTWERSPELFKKFVEQHLGDRSISIAGDAVAALYKDKIPEPGDGKLGWVPGIAEKLEAAKSSGADVEVPLSDWLTHAEPDLAKALHDNIRMWPEGVTGAEARVSRPEVPPPTPTDVGQVRAAAGLEPVFRPAPEQVRQVAEALGAKPSDYPMIIGLDQIDPKAVGLPEGHWQRLQEIARDQYAEDVAHAEQRAEREQKRTQTAEWKSNRKDMEKEVEQDLRAQPHIAADLFVGAGELNGEKIQQRFTLREDDLTPEQKAALPDHYVSKNGLGVDDVAAHFGHGSGDSLVEALAAHHVLKQGRSPNEMLRDMVKVETDRRMGEKYGDLPSNILTAAHDQALSDTTLNLVTQEYQGAAMSAKMEMLTDAHIKDEAKRIADDVANKDVNSRKKLAEVSKNYSDAVKGLLEQDPQATVTALQRRAIGAHVARELLDREKYNAKTEALMKKLARWKVPGKNEVKTVDPEYINWAHVIMDKVGKKIGRSMQTVMEDIAARHDKTLDDFVQSKIDWGREMPVWDQLSTGWRKDWKELNGVESQAVGDSLRSLDFHGRDELKVEKAGEKADRDTVINSMVEQTKRFDRIPADIKGERTDFIGRHTKHLRQFMVNVLQMETFLNYMDKFNPHGTWTQYVMRGLVDGSNQAEAWAKEFTKHLSDANDKADLSKEVENPLFRVPYKDGEGLGPTFRMTRENLRMVLLNAGNSFGAKSNLVKLAKGYDLHPDEVMAWLHTHATKEDWDWAQKVWDDVFEGMWGHGAAMYRSLTGGMTPSRVRIDPIQTRFGEYRGGYMPVDYHPKFQKRIETDITKMQQSNYQSALPQASWAKERTGAQGPINLDMSRLPMLITRELHDIAMRPSLIQASKLLLDSRVQDAVASKMGTEYRDMFKKYLVGVANRQNYLTTHPAYANSMLEQLRKNLVTGLVGFNPGTVMKHAPTAFILTAREIGPEYMLRAYKSLYSLNSETSQAANDLVMGMHEIQRRDRNWEETLYGETLKARPGGMSETWTNQLAKYSAKPVAWSDMFSAKAAALGAYMKAIDQGAEHGDAVYAAERAVRRAHGSTALTNRPQVMRDWNPWFTSVYTFFNDIVNRQMEAAWRAGEMLRDRKTEGTWEAAKAHVPAITASLFAAVIAPAIIEELVSPSSGPDTKHEGLGTKIVKGGFYTLASGLPGVRDFVHGILTGTDPTPTGLWKTAAGGVQNVYRDLFSKKDPWSKEHAQRMIKDVAGPLAMMSGKVTQSMGNVAAFGYGYAEGKEHPKDPWGWVTGLRYGTLKHHSAGFADWMAGRTQ